MLSAWFVSNMDLGATGNAYMFNFIFLILFGLIDGMFFLVTIWLILKLFYKFFKIFGFFLLFVLLIWFLITMLVGNAVNSETIDLNNVDWKEVEKQLNKNNTEHVETEQIQESTNNYGSE